MAGWGCRMRGMFEEKKTLEKGYEIIYISIYGETTNYNVLWHMRL